MSLISDAYAKITMYEIKQIGSKANEQQKKIGLDSIDPKMMARIQALRLMDDDFMSVVFDGDTQLTQFLLRILLSRDDLTVKSVMSQKEKRNLFGRSVRLDIIANVCKRSV